MSVASVSALSTPVASPPIKCAKCWNSPGSVVSGSVAVWQELPEAPPWPGVVGVPDLPLSGKADSRRDLPEVRWSAVEQGLQGLSLESASRPESGGLKRVSSTESLMPGPVPDQISVGVRGGVREDALQQSLAGLSLESPPPREGRSGGGVARVAELVQRSDVAGAEAAADSERLFENHNYCNIILPNLLQYYYC